MTLDSKALAERLRTRADTMNGSLVGASDGATYALGYYDQFAARDDREAATALTSLSARCGEMERALEPFAKAWDRTVEERPDAPDAVPFAVMVDEHDDSVIDLTWGDLRRARAALSRRATTGGGDHD